MAKLIFSTELPKGVSKTDLNQVFSEYNKYSNTKFKFDIAISFVSKLESKKINKQFANNDYPTDVLSFVYPKKNMQNLIHQRIGAEIVICMPIAQKNANKYNTELKSEIALLLIHALMHVSGLDHNTKASQTRFAHTQNDILKILNFKKREMEWLQ